jgi:small subunit ribosomal protein S9
MDESKIQRPFVGNSSADKAVIANTINVNNLNIGDANGKGNSIDGDIKLDFVLNTNGRLSGDINIKGRNIDPADIPQISEILNQLRKLTGDNSISVDTVKSGSIKITISGTPQALELIESLVKSGRFSKIQGFHIKDASLIGSEKKQFKSLHSAKTVYSGTGRRKTSVARVRLVIGSGLLIINGRLGEEYLQYNSKNLSSVMAPLETLGLEKEYDILVNVKGGGLTGQSEAIRLGVARSLCELDPLNRKPLKVEGYLTRDPRSIERKKYGLKKARKAPQYSKR